MKTETSDIDGLMSRVEAVMQGRSAGTIESCKSLLKMVVEQYHTTTIDAALMERVLAESKAAPKSKSNLAWSLRIGVKATESS